MAASRFLSSLHDVHCHPHDSPDYGEALKAQVANVECKQICVMSSNLVNQEMTEELFNSFPDKVIPCFGIHPWFCHALSFESSLPRKEEHYTSLYSDSPHLIPEVLTRLPDPILAIDFWTRIEDLLTRYPTSFIGEVGLDRSFRIPKYGGLIAPHSISNREDTPIEYTELKTPIEHQCAVVEAQLDLAVKLKRNASVHCVQAQANLVSVLQKMQKKYGKEWNGINIDLHSFGGSAETLRQLQKPKQSNIYVSLSTTINARSPKLKGLIQSAAEDKLLAESDWASPVGSDGKMAEIVEMIAEAKSWTIEETVTKLEENWKRFARI